MTENVKSVCIFELTASVLKLHWGGQECQCNYNYFASASATYDNVHEISTDVSLKRGCANVTTAVWGECKCLLVLLERLCVAIAGAIVPGNCHHLLSPMVVHGADSAVLAVGWCRTFELNVVLGAQGLGYLEP